MKYRVCIEEINRGFVDVEADSKEEAEELALQEYEHGDIYWTDSKAEVSEVIDND